MKFAALVSDLQDWIADVQFSDNAMLLHRLLMPITKVKVLTLCPLLVIGLRVQHRYRRLDNSPAALKQLHLILCKLAPESQSPSVADNRLTT